MRVAGCDLVTNPMTEGGVMPEARIPSQPDETLTRLGMQRFELLTAPRGFK